MTTNGPAPVILAFYECVAIEFVSGGEMDQTITAIRDIVNLKMKG